MVCQKKNPIFLLRRPKKLNFQFLSVFGRIWAPGALFWPPEAPRPFYVTELCRCWVVRVDGTLKTWFAEPPELHQVFWLKVRILWFSPSKPCLSLNLTSWGHICKIVFKGLVLRVPWELTDPNLSLKWGHSAQLKMPGQFLFFQFFMVFGCFKPLNGF